MTTLTQTVERVSTAGTPCPTPAPHTVNGKVTTHIKIDETWYDLTNWKQCHPGGALILEQMNGNDATGTTTDTQENNRRRRIRTPAATGDQRSAWARLRNFCPVRACPLTLPSTLSFVVLSFPLSSCV